MSLDAVRADIDPAARAALVRAAARIAETGLSAGRSGNVSVRIDDVIAISPTNAELGSLDPGDLAIVTLDGDHVAGARPSKEVPLHLALYERDPAARAVVHVHSAHAVALSCRRAWADHCAIPPVTPYFLMKVGQVPLIAYRAPGDPLQADDVRSNPWEFRAVLLANHGQIAAGTTLDEAVNAAVEIEEAARTVLLQPDSDYRVLTDEQVRELTSRGRTPWLDRR